MQKGMAEDIGVKYVGDFLCLARRVPKSLEEALKGFWLFPSL